MPPMCVVPHCQTGSRHSRSKNEICPMFNIPKNENLKRKWEEAIPGNLNLKYGHVVCAKHFLENQVITHFELKDKFGNVTEKQAYKRPRLKENAIPSIFEMPICLKESNDDSNSLEHNYSVNFSKSPNHLNEAEIQDNLENNFSKHRDSSDTAIIQNNDFDRDLLKIINNKVSGETGIKRKEIIMYDNDLLNVISRRKSKVLDNRNIESMDFHDISNNHSINGSSVCTDFQFVDINSIINESNSNNISCSFESVTSCNINKNNCENNKYTPKQHNEDNDPLKVDLKSIICINNKEIEVPKSWSIIRKNNENYLTLIFIHSVNAIVSESENKEKIKKYITYNCANGNARYFAHGKEVLNVYKDHLLPRLNSADLLVTTLLKFEKMRMCEGLREEYMPHTIVGEYYIDKFNSWRTPQCTLLTRKFKKCDYCKKLMKKLRERQTRWLHRLETGSKFHANAFTLNTDYKNEVDLNSTIKKTSGTSIEDEYIEEIDSIEFLNYQESVIKKPSIASQKKQKYSNFRINESLPISETYLPTTFQFLFEKEK